MGTKVSIISQSRLVFKGDYADFPAAAADQDLAWADDLQIMFRWSAADSEWQQISLYSGSGDYADIPDYADVLPGSTYYATDTNTLYMAGAADWEPITAGRLTLYNTLVFSSNSPTVATDLDLSSIIGAVNGMVLLLLVMTVSTGPQYWRFREDGCPYALGEAGCNCCTITGAGRGSYVWVKCKAGVVEWYCNGSTYAEIYLQACMAE